MLVGEVLIVEFLAVDRFTSRAVAIGEIAALAHKAFDDPVERGTFVVELSARFGLAFSLLAST